MLGHQFRSRIIRLARSGALDRASTLLEQFAAQRPDSDGEVSLLRGRIKKERAKRATGDEAARLFGEASQHYENAASGENQSYPLINAATLALLAGKTRRAHQLARRVLQVLEDNPEEAETPYWRHATRAEAHLLLKSELDARAALSAAMAQAPQAWEDHAVTIGQFALICRERDLSSAWLDKYRPPNSLHFTGIMDLAPDDEALHRRICETVENENVGFAYGALAAGADILIAECLIKHGAALHVVLPCPRAVFREQSVVAVDPAWGPRFDAALEAAATVEELESSTAPDAASVQLADEVARGMALHNAALLQSGTCIMHIVAPDGESDAPLADHAKHIVLKAPRRDGPSYHVEPAGSVAAYLAIGDSSGETRQHDFAQPDKALKAVEALRTNGDAVALDYRYVPDTVTQPPTSRLELMLAVAEPGQVLASKAFAFALYSRDPSISLEVHGEVRTSDGPVEVYLVA